MMRYRLLIEQSLAEAEKFARSVYDTDCAFVEVGNVEKFDAAYKAVGANFYVGPGGTGAAITSRYQDFGEWLKGPPPEVRFVLGRRPGQPIEAPSCSLTPQDTISFRDGRHRYAWLRDHQMRGLVAMHVDDIARAKQLELITRRVKS